MNTTVYVDVLLVINYIINLLLILCTAKFAGVKPKRRRIVAAALFGAICSLTIFLPFLGFFAELLGKVFLAGVIVRIAFPLDGWGNFARRWFEFFAVSFFFAGIMLAVWMAAAPHWMTYYNGIVYFNISSFSLIIATVIAYLALLLAGRLGRAGRLQGSLCKVRIHLGDKVCAMTGLIDTGNSLSEPFSGAPVVVCQLADVRALLPEQVAAALEKGALSPGTGSDWGVPFRLVPYQGVGRSGVLPAFAPDMLVVLDERGTRRIDTVYVAVSTGKIGDSRYRALLSPDLLSANTIHGGVNI